MASLLTPPTSRSGSELPEDSTAQCLDELLERYLCLLDQQQKLQSSLAEQLSSGFFALAQANFSCPPGRRYGPDYYDERMKATRHMTIQADTHTDNSKDVQNTEDTTDSHDPKLTFSVELASSDESKDASEDSDTERPSSAHNTPSESSEESAVAETSSSGSSDSPEPSTSTSVENTPSVRKKFRSADPIHWYGILVPQSLRRAQTSFTGAIESQVPDLASTTLEMRALEQRISKLRARLDEPSGITQ